ncbi:glycosyltransferase family 2 protein [Ligilactobacillus equi]|uniref:glycosyltransferase family 2 protein n=1 Tax=Ligilactobacillus equi TaxID=137357 RepID=UPI002ED27F6E
MSILKRLINISRSMELSIFFHNHINNLFFRKIIDTALSPFAILKIIYMNSKKNEVFNRKRSIYATLIIKNESAYIEEWLDYHILLGIEKFIIFNNESTDNIGGKLKPYIKRGIVELHNIRGVARQMDAYNLALNKVRKTGSYLVVLDADEFLFLPNPNDNFVDIVNNIFNKNKNIGGVVFNWLIFGSSNYKVKQKKLVTQTFLNRSKYSFSANKHIKSLVDPEKTLSFPNPHFALYKKNCYAVNINNKRVDGPFNEPIKNPRVRINHYFTKSREEFMAKRARGVADQKLIRNISDFENHDRNDIFDDSMKRYSSQIFYKADV